MSLKKPSILCVANWDSNVGYAWWLMESFWVKIAEHYGNEFNVFLAYPSITIIPEKIKNSNLKVENIDFTFLTSSSIFAQLDFIYKQDQIYLFFR